MKLEEKFNKKLEELNKEQYNITGEIIYPTVKWELLAFIKQEIKELTDKMIGKEDICNEKMFGVEDGYETENGSKFWSTGYNGKREEIINIVKEYDRS